MSIKKNKDSPGFEIKIKDLSFKIYPSFIKKNGYILIIELGLLIIIIVKTIIKNNDLAILSVIESLIDYLSLKFTGA
jgi:hypothetical protein